MMPNLNPLSQGGNLSCPFAFLKESVLLILRNELPKNNPYNGYALHPYDVAKYCSSVFGAEYTLTFSIRGSEVGIYELNSCKSGQRVLGRALALRPLRGRHPV